MKKALVALALLVSATGASFAQTAAQSVMGFLLDQGSTYNGYTCPATNTSPCFVQYGDTVPTSGGGGGGSDVNITEVGGNAVTTTVPVSGSVGLTGAIPAGTNVIGHVITDTGSVVVANQPTAANLNATVVGTGTFAVQNTAALPAGSNIIGNVRIDQTTAGTTNGVVTKAGSTTVVTPTNTTVTVTPVTVGVASAQALAASTATKYLFIQNVSTTANIACNFGGTAALNTAGSFMLVPNQSRTFEGSFVPSTVLNCIASAAATPLTIESN